MTSIRGSSSARLAEHFTRVDRADSKVFSHVVRHRSVANSGEMNRLWLFPEIETFRLREYSFNEIRRRDCSSMKGMIQSRRESTRIGRHSDHIEGVPAE